jgi:sugar-specific transcriptional regulator TrmB
MKKTKIKAELNLIDSKNLVNLGLTKHESACYINLLQEGSLTGRQLADITGILPNAVYRLIKNLIDKGLITALDTSPTTYQALPPQIAISTFIKNKTQKLEEISAKTIQQLTDTGVDSSQTRVDIITSRQKMFSSYVEFAKSAKEEILIISIGEPVPDEIKLVNRDVMETGVKIKFIVHKYDKENKELLKSYVKMGYEIKHFPDQGYHLMIFDGKISILASSNPKNPAERTGMIIYSKGVARAHKSYFYSVWNKAMPVNK